MSLVRLKNPFRPCSFGSSVQRPAKATRLGKASPARGAVVAASRGLEREGGSNGLSRRSFKGPFDVRGVRPKRIWEETRSAPERLTGCVSRRGGSVSRKRGEGVNNSIRTE